MKSYASVSKELISDLFGEENIDCYITHIDVWGEDIFTIIILGDRQVIAHFNKELKLVYHRFIDETELRVTALKVISSGIVCTGLIGNEPSYEFNSFVLFKFNFDLDLLYIQEYDILYTRHNPQIVETSSGDIVCSGIRVTMAKHVVHTFCIRFAYNLTMLNSIIYDTEEVVHITKLVPIEDNSVIAVGYKNIINRKTHILTEAATALLFQASNLSGFITQENIWIDRSSGNTHLNDVTLINQDTFIAVGYSKLDSDQNATIWKFNVVDGKITRLGVKCYKDPSVSTLYTKITQVDSEIMILGRVYDAEVNETFIIAEVDKEISYIKSIRLALFKICEEMNNMLFHENTVYCIGAKERIMDNVCSGIIKQIIFSKDAVQ